MEENQIKGVIYLSTNTENNKKYVGATTLSLEIRKKDHIQKSINGTGYDFHNAIHTYGADAFL